MFRAGLGRGWNRSSNRLQELFCILGWADARQADLSQGCFIRSLRSPSPHKVNVGLELVVRVRCCDCARHVSVAFTSLLLRGVDSFKVGFELVWKFDWAQVSLWLDDGLLAIFIVKPSGNLRIERFYGNATSIATYLLSIALIQSEDPAVVLVLPDHSRIEHFV